MESMYENNLRNAEKGRRLTADPHAYKTKRRVVRMSIVSEVQAWAFKSAAEAHFRPQAPNMI